MVEIIQGVGRQRLRRRGGEPLRPVLDVDDDGVIGDALDSWGDDTDFDSVELMVSENRADQGHLYVSTIYTCVPHVIFTC